MNINKKIDKILSERGKSIIVLKGFETVGLPYEKKYFPFEIKYYDKVNLEKIKETVTEIVVDKRSFEEEYLWMTIEEFQLFKEEIRLNKVQIVILENNLYDKEFPYNGKISNIEKIYKLLYFREDEELNDEESILYENISYFYGTIDYSKQSNRYYVIYPEYENIGNLYIEKFFEEEYLNIDLSVDLPKENIKQIELSEVELPFLDLTEEIINMKKIFNIIFVISGNLDELPNNYNSRINILMKNSSNKFYFITKSLRRKFIKNEEEYTRILKSIYGYKKFKELEFYKNIEIKSKESVFISQVQIIDDIVTESEKALSGEGFRDIYITAPTGSGKSVMFQIPALYLAKKYNNEKPLTIVISPLIGLMNDQVNTMKNRGLKNLATINGNTPPFERENILNKIQNNEIDILYLSPETLQARSDIRQLIGERNIGVVIIDEAHIVTTWGKSFRADYWYLGIYLSKLRKEYKFPIVTFTATAIYGGKEDMYLDTRNSLNMISPISYFGNVSRKNILMRVRNGEKTYKESGKDYRKTKNVLAFNHIYAANKKNEKSLLYFPTIKLLNEFYRYLDQNDNDLSKLTGKYYGSLSKEEKDEVLNEFKNGELKFVLATKAFGMGIDISDINNVYHYAPTGNVVDYIQEIGRVARDSQKVRFGFGVIDYLAKDMGDVKKLYGMSAIRKNQILEVMKKILSIYKEKGYNRNLLISSDDFKYIFEIKKGDENTLDNKVKTVLLMIEKDFSSPNKLGYSPFVARPRSLYGNDLIFVDERLEKLFKTSILGEYFTKLVDIKGENYSSVYEVNLSGIWEKYYKNISFPSFKYNLFTSQEYKLKHDKIFKEFIFTSGVDVSISNNEDKRNVISKYNRILDVFKSFSDTKRISEKEFTINDLGNYLMSNLNISDKFEAKAFAQTLINAAFEFNKLEDIKFIKERENFIEKKVSYKIQQDADIFKKFILSGLYSAINPKSNYEISDSGKRIKTFQSRQNSDMDKKVAALGIGQSKNILSYQIIGGNNPQIYLRMNSVGPLEKSIKEGEYYRNNILREVQNKHYISIEMLKYLFEHEQPEYQTKGSIVDYTKWFWEQIENYFMGILPEKVEENIQRKFE